MSETLREILDRIGLADIHDLLAAQDVDADMLAELTEQDLRELGLTLGQRNRFLKAIRALAAQPPRPSRAVAERRQLTTLFCDLVASTRLATQIDPEDLRDVIQSYQGFCTGILRAHGGHLAYSQGDGLMAYFGFPLAGEDDPERALRAGLEIADRIAQLETAAPEPLQIRIGIATGIVVVGDSEDGAVAGAIVVGETPNLAARLQQAAQPGEVIIAEATRRLCGAMFEYENRGAVEFKGFEDPVPVYRVIRESAAPNRFEAHAGSGLSPIVGRDAELGELRRLWRSALGGEGGTAIVSGEAGIGKSRLTRAFIEHVRKDRHRILQWHCAAHLANRPLHPIARELEVAVGLARGMPPEQKREALERHVAATPGLGSEDIPWLADLLGLTNQDRPDLDAQTRARLLSDALVRRVVAQDVPTIVILEDAHWADPATIELVTALRPHLANRPVMVVITHRPNFAPPWSEDEHCAKIRLQGIDVNAGEALLRVVAKNRPLPGSLARIILEKAGGVPLFVEELTKTVLDSASDEALLAQGVDAVLLPATLQDSLMARLDRLGDAKEIAQLGSVIGREFSADMLRVIAPEYRDIEDNLRRLCESGLAYERGGEVTNAIVFHHALIQDAAYEALLKKRRREVHRAIAEAMITGQGAFAGAEPETIARHCQRGGLEKAAVQHWFQAGMNALDRAANAPALTYLTSALEQLEKLPEDRDRAINELRIQLSLAPAIMSLRGWAHESVERTCRRAHQLAVHVGDKGAEMGALWGLWTNSFLRGDLKTGIAMAHKVADIAAADGTVLSALEAGHALCMTYYSRGEFHEARQALDAGMRRYDPVQDAIGLKTFQLSPSTAMLTVVSNAEWFLGNTAAADEMMAQAHARADTLNHLPTLVCTLCVSSFSVFFRHEWSRLAPVAARALAISEAEGFAFWAPMARVYLTFAEQRDPGEIAEVTTGFIDGFGSLDYKLTLSQFEVELGKVLIKSGECALAEKRLTASIEDARLREEICYMPEALRIRGEARKLLGDRAAAWEDFDAARKLALRQAAVPLVARIDQSLAALEERSGAISWV